ncbi:MAG: type I 3-dehydroquinate dehydratase [Patescibacteria group bacterium]|nr:type I 3-dehydroquinate dehydratase [Patescibacteria group bacterium]
MKAKICLPIIKTTIKDVEEMIEANRENYDMFEVWIDHLNESFPEILKLIRELSQKLGNRFLVVFRRRNGESIHIPLENRLRIITQLATTNTFFDIDIEKQKNDLEEISRLRLRPNMILSFHDFEKTPRTSTLVKIVDNMHMYHPSIYKIATYCQTEKQAIALLHLLLDMKEQGKRCVIIGMGQKGIITRIFGTLWGNEIAFVPENTAGLSAPGQLNRKQMEDIFAIVEEDYAR